jgi:hypothetical protein
MPANCTTITDWQSEPATALSVFNAQYASTPDDNWSSYASTTTDNIQGQKHCMAI